MSELRPRDGRAQTSRAQSRSHAGPGIARHGRLRKHNPFATIVKVIAGAVAVVLVSGVSVAAIAAWDVASSVQPGIALDNETNGPVPQIGAIDGGVNLLLVGSDSAQGSPDGAFGEREENLNDVTMLMHISQDHKNVSVVSFPRDLFVDIPECTDADGDSTGDTNDKINTTLFYGGLSCTVSTVEQLTGLSIPFAAEIQFNGVIEMSNAVGGVPVCVSERIEDEYTGTFLDPGMHDLSGVDALQFLRTRHGIGDGSDLTRISNQQVFLSSLVRTVKSSQTLTDPLKLYGLAKAAAGNMQLSNSLNNLDTMVSIALALKDVDLEEVVFVQYPTFSVDGGVEPNTDAADVLFGALAADQPIALSGTTGGGAVIDPNAPVDPNAPADPAVPADPNAPVDPAVPADPNAPATPDAGTGTTVLPDAVTGQTAGQYTCSVGRTLEDQ
ncbi:LCP family protein [Compostimonas suwonensis]|uniref:LCP family protein required for cell wall assembly n=1 Tax=Compostimonas suwonensis TaxID=1048394 RepID=A0A2M9C3M5_9MICO|nr:LCP family protein [Compostimonas suwonensis]PJJ65112.1 LCP family protein required for cell wall assembly [Compostimonas suwonensis]